MIKWIIQKIVGSKNEREVKRMLPLVAKINEIEEALQLDSDEAILDKVNGWKSHLHQYLPIDTPSMRQIDALSDEERQEIASKIQAQLDSLRPTFSSLPQTVEANSTSIEAAKNAFEEIEDKFPVLRAEYLDRILPEVFAVVKNTARRMCGEQIEVNDQTLEWNMIHFDVQLIGGMALHNGLISEMQTGEGKTLVATLPVFLNALTGMGVHVVTVNDYLAKRDSEWMGALYKRLGLSVGCIENQQHPFVRAEQYRCDITYGTNSEFGFDYLRDNGMSDSKEEQVQSRHYFAVIDEVDSVLIDEARTPLIISGPSEASSTEQYERYKPQVESLVKKQNLLCNELAEEAKKALEDGDEVSAGRALFKLKLGSPRSRQLFKMMQEPDMRRLIDTTELSMYQDAQKKDLYAIKEELYFTVDEKGHDADLMDMGREFLSPGDPEAFTLPDIATLYGEIDADPDIDEEGRKEKKADIQDLMDKQGVKMHAIAQLLKAYCLFEKDVEYVVEEGKVHIVDEQTGRKMAGRRWSDGLHQAVEAKENLHVEAETQTYATITIQNYFRLYHKLGGMTGTAETEATEFHDIYKLDVLPIPTNVPNTRVDHNDQVFKTRREKYNAVVTKIQECNEKGQPVLVGTASVDASETLSRMLKRSKIKHQVLNAKYHEQEAEIITNAGKKGAVTVSSNMAGRGTDIKLGEGVPEIGGLYVIGCERYPSRRVDRQLRGRCARQGDPGMSQFFISFEDDLMRNFAAADRMTTMMDRFGMAEGEALEHKWLNKSVETAQRRVEQRDYLGRKRILEFDDVMNQQREVIYGYRNEILRTDNPTEKLNEIIEEAVPAMVHHYMEERDDGAPDYAEMLNWINTTFPLGLTMESAGIMDRDVKGNSDFIIQKVKEAYAIKTEGEEALPLDNLERHIIISSIDKLWKDHLYQMDALREGVFLRAQGQKDPLVEYKNEAYSIFEDLYNSINNEVLYNLFRLNVSLNSFQQFLEQNDLPIDMTPEQLEELMKSSEATAPQTPQVNVAQTVDHTTLNLETEKPVKVDLPKRKPMQIRTGGSKGKKKKN